MNPRRSIVSRIGHSIGATIRDFSVGMSNGRWEGAEHTRQRARGNRALESVDWGVNYGVREGMLSEARNLEQTFAICRRINRQYANHCVGSCRMKWHTGDSNINRIYHDAFETWKAICDVQRRHTFQKLTKIAVCRTIVDGRTFGQLDRRNGFLQIQPVEGDRVSSDGIFNADRPGLVSGIGLDANGGAAYMRVWERSLYGAFQNPQNIPAVQMVHVFDTDRFDSISGVTGYNTVLNTVRDLLETAKAERLSAKRNSKLALLVKTIMGGATGSPLFDNANGASAGNSAPEGKVQQVSDIADVYTFPGEDIHSHTSERPSDGWRWLMEWMVREIAAGLDLPFGVVWHMSGLGGPAVRFEINQANRTFMAFLKNVLEPMWFRPIVGGWITLEMNEGRLPFHPAWYKFQCPRPKAITIDLGRDSKAGIAENAAGLSTATDWYVEDDMDFEEQTDRLVYEAKYREASRLGIPIEQVKEIPLEQIRALGNVSTALAGQATEEDEPEPDESQKGQNEKQIGKTAAR